MECYVRYPDANVSEEPSDSIFKILKLETAGSSIKLSNIECHENPFSDPPVVTGSPTDRQT
jgi:hypothetical protein